MAGPWELGRRAARVSQQICVFRIRRGPLGGVSGSSTYHALQCADLDALEDLAGLVAVSNILESLRGILSGNVEKDLLSTSVI